MKEHLEIVLNYIKANWVVLIKTVRVHRNCFFDDSLWQNPHAWGD